MGYDPNKFKTASPVISSVSATELATGRGVGIFYLTDDATGTKFMSSEIQFAFDGEASNDSGALDIDFDVTILQPMNLEGDCIISIPVRDNSGSGAVNRDIGVKLRKFDGSEIEIVSANADTTVSTTDKFQVMTFKLTVPNTHFAVGDILRVTVTVETNTGGGFGVVIIFFDPSNINTDSDVLTTQAVLKIPIILDRLGI